jgi:diacylglycerol O-acyltransferase-1
VLQVQFLLPLMQSSLMPLHETNLLRFTERLLRLSVPNVAHWLIMFYLVFHLWLNILGELLMFGDRLFYKACYQRFSAVPAQGSWFMGSG